MKDGPFRNVKSRTIHHWQAIKIRAINMGSQKMILRFVIVSLVIFGCETERRIFNGPYHVRFSEAALSEKESVSDPLEIEVHYVGPEVTEDLDIQYTIAGSAREGVDYVI